MTTLTLFDDSTLWVSSREAVPAKTVEIKSPIKRLVLLTFAGIVGALQWHEVTKDERVVGKLSVKCCPCYEVQSRLSRMRIVNGVGM